MQLHHALSPITLFVVIIRLFLLKQTILKPDEKCFRWDLFKMVAPDFPTQISAIHRNFSFLLIIHQIQIKTGQNYCTWGGVAGCVVFK